MFKTQKSLDKRGSEKQVRRNSETKNNNMFVAEKNHGGAGPSTPNDSQYFTGRFGLSKDSSMQQVNLSCKNTLTEDDLITSNYNQTDLQL